MANCEQYQAQLLAYLYDLLEADEEHALRDHLSLCASCQSALAAAERQRKLLAAAAKAEFPAVRFQPPRAGEVLHTEESPARSMPLLRTPWFAWAVAASILLLLSFSLPATILSWRYKTAQTYAQMIAAECDAKQAQALQLHHKHEAAVAQTQQQVLQVQEQVRQLGESQQQKWAALQKAERERQLKVLVSGPETIQPGAPNHYQVVTRNRNNQPVPSQLAVRVLDAAKQVLYEAKNVNSPGAWDFSLPANLPVQANSKVSLEVVARQEGGREEQIREELALAAPVYLTHLTTDKPMYRPGETVHFRSLTLERYSLKPAEEDFQLVYSLTKPTGEEVPVLTGSPLLFDEKTQTPLLGPDKKPIRGLGAGEIALEPAARGGEYTLTVREAATRFAPQQRKFIVNQYENPRLNKDLDFTRKSYGPGDDVVAACKVSRVEGGGIVANQPVIATITIDGKPYSADGKEGARPLVLRTDAKGAVNVRFRLPRVIERGQATLSVQFQDGASTETLVRPIPIVVKRLQIEFFPEGGELVPGVKNRVYFQARTMLDKPAEVKARIVDQHGKVVVDRVETLHDDQEPGINQGMGLFAFTPLAEHQYELKIDTPSGIEGKYELPAVKAGKVGLSIPTAVTRTGEAIHVEVFSSQQDRTLLVGAYCRGRLLDHRSVVAKKDEATTVDLHPAQEMGGVYRITVFEERSQGPERPQLVPVAERLVYRKPAEQLILTVKPDRKQYIPGDKVNLSLTALNEKEQPAPSILLVAVVDKSVVTMADEKTFRSMPTHYYLTTEVRRPEDLEYADVLLGSHPEAATALDLLLGTQGWRRFAEQNPDQFRQQFKDDAARLLVTMGQTSQQSVDLAQRSLERMQKEFETKLAQLHDQEAKAREAWVAAQNGADFKPEMERLQSELGQLQQTRLAAARQVEEQRARIGQVWSVISTALTLILAGALVLLVVLAVRRSWPRALPYYALAGLCTLLIMGVVWLHTEMRSGADNRAALPESSDMPPLAQRTTPHQPLLGEHGEAAPPPGAPDQLIDGFRAKDRKTAEELHEKLKGFIEADAALPEASAERAAGKGGRATAPAAARAQPVRGDNRFQLGLQLQNAPTALNRAEDPQMAQKRELYERIDPLARDKGAAKPAFRAPAANVAKGAVGQQLALRRNVQANGRQALPQPGGLGGLGGGFGGAMPAGKPGLPAPGGFGGGLGLGGGPGMPGWADRPFGAERGMPPGPALQPLLPPVQPLIVREYAHVRPTTGPGEARSDFVDTVYWHPVLVLPDGKTDITFDLCDAVTSYQVLAVGHTLDGRLGAVTSTLESRLPFALEPKLPIEVTSSDRIDVPVSIANNTSDPRAIRLHVTPTGLNLLQGQNDQALTVAADQRTRRLFRFQPALVEGQARLRIEGESSPFADSVSRTFQVVPEGFPIVNSRSDVLEKVAHHDVVLPETWVKGTLKCQVQVYPSTLADLQNGLEALLREPGGCFEQTSTSNYPNLLILDYLKESNQAKPEAERRARDLLAKGYQKLVAFECLDTNRNQRQGYEWFGGTAPAHEALTAYGLLQFRDMARVYDVDRKMLERTRQYLMSRKDGKGGFQRNPRALDTFGRAPDDVTNAYIVWALTESGKDDDIEKELAALSAQARTSKDPYFLSLVGIGLINRSKTDDGVALLKTVADAQKPDGHVDAARTSITGSGGRDLQIETTALAVLGWLKANRPADFNAPLQKAVQWIGQQRGGYGGFGSTQSTILALKALIAFTKANKKTAESGELRLLVDEQVVVHANFAAGVQEALVLHLPEPEKQLKPGKNSLRVEITGKNTFPYTLSWSYQTLKPASAENCPVRLNTHLDRAIAAEGETVHLNVTLENATDKGQGMAVAIIGLPGGLTLPEDMKQLKDHARLRNDGKEKGLIAAWETRGRELILYWRDLAPKQKIEVPIDLICRVPGEYRGPASRAYLYYNADVKAWVEPLSIRVSSMP